jgi:hypothetical protein
VIFKVSALTDFVAMSVPARRLDDRIRELCSEAVAIDNSQEAAPILAELRSSLYQYTDRLRGRAAAILSGGSDFPIERRKAPSNRAERSTP